jgi:16S rRNA (cytidine1402-2'-O)-methyltransferase
LLTFIPTPIGNIADISLRTLDVLSKADIILCEDTRITKQLILILKERYNLQTKQDLEFISLHSHNEKAFIEKLSPSFFEKNVVYASDAGLPVVSDPGSLLVKYALEHNIKYDVLPGANAALTAFVASGFCDTRFLFWGFLPHKGKDREISLQNALNSGYITILYESPHRLQKLLKEIDKNAPDREIFLAKELTKKFQNYLKGNAKDLLLRLDGNFKGEWVVILDKSENISQNSAITIDDINSLDIPKKQKAKLLSKITGKSVKELYSDML